MCANQNVRLTMPTTSTSPGLEEKDRLQAWKEIKRYK